MLSVTNVLCGPRQSRRYLIFVNVLTGIIGFILLGVGSFSLETGGRIKDDVLNVFCEEQCQDTFCAQNTCSPPGCDCSFSPPQSSISTEFFTAPSAGLAAVGFLSMVASIVGCMAAVRAQPLWLALYIIAIIILIILQFSFGIAAAAVGTASPDLQNFFLSNSLKVNWGALSMVLPEGCYASKTVDKWGENSHPACTWDGACVPELDDGIKAEYGVTCCGAGGVCADNPFCSTANECISGLLRDIGVPVAVAALLTIIFQFFAIGWAWTVRKETKAGGVFDKDRMRV
mmetsp:Transcript_31421/g.77022  ORF Transcript_31421/g.77022 Transcript_31421/m.77022 type:complete len:287 (+) Transcript_31421:288-1148(+)